MSKVSEEEKLEIKAHTRRAVELAGGTVCFAAVAGVSKGQLSRYGSTSEDDLIRADVIIAHVRDTGSPMLLDFLARMVGYRLVPLEAEPAGTVGIADVSELARAGGAVVHTLAAALEDGAIDPGERRDTRARIADGIATLHRLDRKLAGGQG